MKPILCVRKVYKYKDFFYGIPLHWLCWHETWQILRDVESVFFAWKENLNATALRMTRLIVNYFKNTTSQSFQMFLAILFF